MSHSAYERFTPPGGDVNLYAYVWNSPTNFTHPIGLCGVSDIELRPRLDPGFETPQGGLYRRRAKEPRAQVPP